MREMKSDINRRVWDGETQEQRRAFLNYLATKVPVEDLWSLDHTLHVFLAVRLKAFKEHSPKRDPEYVAALDKAIEIFTLAAVDDEYYIGWCQGDREKLKQLDWAYDWLKEHYGSLTW